MITCHDIIILYEIIYDHDIMVLEDMSGVPRNQEAEGRSSMFHVNEIIYEIIFFMISYMISCFLDHDIIV